jgi:anti-sigma regulatory factor (Ser/Thr protein kinase)
VFSVGVLQAVFAGVDLGINIARRASSPPRRVPCDVPSRPADVRHSGQQPDGGRSEINEADPLFDVRLSPDRAAAARARAALDEIRQRLSQAAYDDARLMVSEIVTNSLRHAGLSAGQPIRLLGHLRGRRLRVEVFDAGAGFVPEERGSDVAEDTGWGLYIVRRLATDWGVTTDGETKVWFEVDAEGEDSPA